MSVNLDLDQVVEGQSAAEVTINDATGQLDAALTDSITLPVTGSNALSITADQLRRHNYFLLSDGGASALSTITIPAVARGMFVVQNSTTQDIEVSISGQTWPVVEMADGDVFVLHADGTDCRAVGGGGGVDLGAITDQYLLYNNTGVIGGLPQSTFVKADGTVAMTGDLNMSTGAGRALALRSISTTYSRLTSEAAFWELVCDSNAANYTYLLSASGFAPGDSGTAELGDTSYRWEKVWSVALDCSGASQFADDISLMNAKVLRLYESGSGNYIGLKAGTMAADKTFTLPVADGSANAYLMTDGSANLSFDSPAYDFTGFFAGAPTAGELITRIVVARSVTMPINLTGSQGYIATAATAQTDFDIQVNGVSKGTMRFAAAANTATFIFAAPVSLVAGDLVSIVAPNPADATAANLSFCIKCTRTS